MADLRLKLDPNNRNVLGAINDSNGDIEPLYVDNATGRLKVDASVSGAALMDGADSDIKATILDYTNSNPLAVRLTDTNGDYVSAGAGTQYTEDDAAAANPVGNALIGVRADTLGALTTTDGDNVALRATNKGELYVKQSDAIVLGAGTAAIGKLVANSGVDIGDVDVTTLPAITIAAAQTLANVTTLGTITNVVHVDDNSGALTIDGTVSCNSHAVYAQAWNGAAYGDLQLDGSGYLKISLLTALPAGTAAIGKLAANSGVDIGDVDVTSIAAGTNKIGDVDIAPRTTGGWSVMNATSGDNHTALTATAQVIKASAGKFGGYYIYNPNAAATYVHVYNVAAASVTVGTTEALLNFCIPASSAANLEILAGIPFGTAMSWAATTTGGGNTAPTTALEAMAFYV